MPELTESDARRLLGLAADTVEVAPSAPLPAPRRPWWPVLAAAAVVLAVLAGGLWWSARDTSVEPAPAPVPTPTAPTRPSSGLPGVLGYDESEARAVLADAGVRVTGVRREAGCGEVPGRALRAEPAGNRRATLVLTAPAPHCPPGIDHRTAWALLDLADGEAVQVPWAGTVGVQTATGETEALTRAQMSDPASLPPRLRAALVSGLAEARATPEAGWRVRVDMEEAYGGESMYDFSLVADDGRSTPWQVVISVGNGLFGPNGKVTGLELRAPDGWESPFVTTVPSVFAYDAAGAERALREAGYDVQVTEVPTCGPPRRAERTEPAAGTRLVPGSRVVLRVTVSDPTAFCALSPVERVAWQVVDLALGQGRRRPWADVVPASALAATRETVAEARADGRPWTLRVQERGREGTAWLAPVGGGESRPWLLRLTLDPTGAPVRIGFVQDPDSSSR